MHPAIEELSRKISCFPGVEQIILFGSRATGKERPFSDIDLAVAGVQDETEWAHVRQVAEDAHTLLKIDLVRFETADDAIRDSILREGKVLYERTTHTSGG